MTRFTFFGLDLCAVTVREYSMVSTPAIGAVVPRRKEFNSRLVLRKNKCARTLMMVVGAVN